MNFDGSFIFAQKRPKKATFAPKKFVRIFNKVKRNKKAHKNGEKHLKRPFFRTSIEVKKNGKNALKNRPFLTCFVNVRYFYKNFLAVKVAYFYYILVIN